MEDVELMLKYVELNSEAARMISAQNAGGYVISFDSFANYASTVAAGKNADILIPTRYSSLKTLFSIFWAQTDIGKANAKTISARVNRSPMPGRGITQSAGKIYHPLRSNPTPKPTQMCRKRFTPSG